MRLFYGTRSNLYNVFVLKCVSTTISIEHYMEGVIIENEEQTFFERFVA